MGIEAILAMALPLFGPVLMDGVKMIFSKITGVELGGPKNFQDTVQLEKVKIDKINALAALDRPSGDVSRWVADLRGSFRYIAVGLIILASLLYCFLPPGYQTKETGAFLQQLSGSAIFFIIGDRVYLGLKNGK
jgi:hypothetical protein